METILTLRSISTEAAQAAVAAALARAAADGCAVAAAVVDAAGELVAFLRAAGAPFHSSGIARDKAYTAASFRMPTAALYDAVGTSAALREGITRRDRMVMFGGGLPVSIGSDMVGGIGVSGASETMDVAYANAGLAAIGARQF